MDTYNSTQEKHNAAIDCGFSFSSDQMVYGVENVLAVEQSAEYPGNNNCPPLHNCVITIDKNGNGTFSRDALRYHGYHRWAFTTATVDTKVFLNPLDSCKLAA